MEPLSKWGSYNSLRIVNSIIWNNPGLQVNYIRYGQVTLNNCVTEELGGVGNIQADPLFKNTANGNYHLQAGSPAIDTGMNPASVTWLNFPVVDDIEDTPRPLDGDGLGAGTTGDGSDFDIGAYEFK